MAFKQYTRCIEASDFSSRVRYITIASLLAGTPAALVAVAMNHPVCLVIALEITGLAALVAYYHNWLYHRLICLGGDRECVGAIVSIGGPTELGLNFCDRDTDYSINLLLKNCDYGPTEEGLTDAEKKDLKRDLQTAAQETLPYGDLITPQASVLAIGLEQEGHFGMDRQTKRIAAGLHAEFEGDGNYKMLLTSKVLLALAIYSLIACMFLPWPANIILGLGFFLFSLLALFVSSLLSLFGEGDPSDVGAGELTDNSGIDENTGMGVGANIVYIKGAWVLDTLHERWNEIHPIKICCVMEGKWEGEWPPDNIILRLRDAFQVAQSEDTIVNQALPEYQWQVHPYLDGCSRDVIL